MESPSSFPEMIKTLTLMGTEETNGMLHIHEDELLAWLLEK